MNNPQIWQAVAAIVAGYAAVLGGAYAVITVPLERAIKTAFHDRESAAPLEQNHDHGLRCESRCRKAPAA